jgi:hypothetical protein
MLWKTFLSSRARKLQLKAVVIRELSRLQLNAERDNACSVATNVTRLRSDHALQKAPVERDPRSFMRARTKMRPANSFDFASRRAVQNARAVTAPQSNGRRGAGHGKSRSRSLLAMTTHRSNGFQSGPELRGRFATTATGRPPA